MRSEAYIVYYELNPLLFKVTEMVSLYLGDFNSAYANDHPETCFFLSLITINLATGLKIGS